MSIHELTIKVKEAAKQRTSEQRAQLLRDANIIDGEGYFCKNYFSKETIEKDKKST
jgi:hypothetical protein